MARIDQINELLKVEISEQISRIGVLPNGLITVSYIDCSPDFASAKIGVSVLPEKLTGTALRELKRNTSQIASGVAKKVKFKKLPRFSWEFDPREKKMAELEEALKQ